MRSALGGFVLLTTIGSGTLAGQAVAVFPVPTSPSSQRVGPIAAGPEGSLWFGSFGGAIERISLSGQVSEFPIDSGSASINDITSGPDGNLWYTLGEAPAPAGHVLSGRIGRMTTNGVFTEFPVSRSAVGIASGLDGNLWFTDSGSVNSVGRITPAGVVTEFPIAGAQSLGGIVAAPDGNLWFTESSGRIGRISLTGEIREFSAGGSPGFFPNWITVGSDGDLWFTESSQTGIGRIGRMTVAGLVSEFQIPATNVSLRRIVSGPDGDLWFTAAGADPSGNVIGRMSPNGAVMLLPTSPFVPDGIAAGPDGNVWFTAFEPSPGFGSNEIGRIDLGTGCQITGTALCLGNARFRVEVSWSASNIGESGVGQAIPLTSDSGAFWFFQPSNIELVIKVLDGRTINGHFWVFYGALSNVAYTITVTDTQTGAVKTYVNPEGHLASSADTEAF